MVFSTDTPILHITQHTYADTNNYVKIYSTSNGKNTENPKSLKQTKCRKEVIKIKIVRLRSKK